MKKILITGANSYVGTSFENYLKQWVNEYEVDTIDMIDGTWVNKDFSNYDTVFHVAGIAHVSTDPKMEDLYYKVNRDLTIDVATKSKNDGVKQFIFMSSIIVYGDSSKINEKRIIDKNTIPNPSNFYGNSKLQAEQGILPLNNERFKVVIIRPPMIYGKGSKGNYPKLAKLATKVPIFPNIKNERSMLYIDNLCEFIRIMIENEEKGLFFPQNKEYVNTSELVKEIAYVHGKNMKLTRLFNPIINIISNHFNLINKVFGNLVYDKRISDYSCNYRVTTLKQSIYKTEKL